MDTPVVSVIMSVYNGEDYLSQSIQSILQQTLKDYEFIIVDDASTDNSYEIMQPYARTDGRILVIRNSSNLGLAQSLNIALNHSRGTFIARMDADDIAVENRLEIQVRYLRENQEVVLTGSSIYLIDLQNNIISKSETITNPEILRKLINYQNISAHPTWMFRREILQDLKGYRDLPTSQDYDFLMRLFSLNYKISNIDTPLLYYRVSEKNITYERNLIQTKISRYLRRLYKMGLILDDRLVQREKIEKITTTSKITKHMHNLALKFVKQRNSLMKKNLALSDIIYLFLAGLLSPYMAYVIYCAVRARLLLMQNARISK